MEITGFRCPCKTDRNVVLPLDHYSSGACTAPPGPMEWIASMLAGVASDDHKGGRITATRLLRCPRQEILADEVPLAIDVRRLHSLRAGTMWHKEMARHPRADSNYEVSLGPAEVLGIPLSGRLDRVSKDWGEIEDWKTHAESSMGFKWRDARGGKLDRELAAQLNLYRILIAKSILKVDPAEYKPRLIGWHLAMVRAQPGPGEPPPKPGKNGKMPELPPPSAFRVVLPIMSEEDIGRLRPFDSEDAPGTQPYSVSDIVAMYVAYQWARSNGMSREEALKRHVPLVGRGIWRGTCCTRYCAALEECDKVEGIRR